jgi:hypothetical protein
MILLLFLMIIIGLYVESYFYDKKYRNNIKEITNRFMKESNKKFNL